MNKTELGFYDDYWLDLRKNVYRNWYEPVYAGSFAKTGFYPSATWCPESGKYRLWFETVPDMAKDGKRQLSLAQSDDGINWETRNEWENIYDGDGGLHGTSVIRDSYEKDPQKLYKAVGMTGTGRMYEQPGAVCPLVLSVSADGVKWTKQGGYTVYEKSSDTYNCIFYNPVTGKYCVTMRPGFIDRRIGLTQSEDLMNWSRPQIILHPDAGYEDNSKHIQLYAMWTGWQNGVFLGLLWRFYTSLVDGDFTKMNGFMDTELVYSYDGNHFMRTTKEPIIKRPAPPGFGHTQLNFSSLFETKENDRWILVASASRALHGTEQSNKQLARKYPGKAFELRFYEIRKNGFCGLECCTRGGIITTKPFLLMDADLTFNISAPFGYARFALCDVTGNHLKGFSFDDCIPFEGDKVNAKPVWRNKDIREIEGKRIRISVELNTAVLYSISGLLRPYICVPQTSINDPVSL